MIEVYPSLYVGSENDEQQLGSQPGWRVIHACKEPYHRQALGYSGRAAAKDHPEYLIARRGDRLVLNLVDAPSPEYIPQEIIDAALAFIDEGLKAKNNVLVHCNQGESRGPSLGLLYLAVKTDCLPTESLEAAEAEFRKLYPNYNPKSGIHGFLQLRWTEYMSRRAT